MIEARLRIVGGKLDGKVITLPKGKFLIGREEDCQLRPKSDLVSRHHCVFTTDDYATRLRDLGSTNGTFVNGKRIQGQVVLAQDDQVKVGKLGFLVRLTDVAEPEPEVEQDELQDTSVKSTSETIVDMPVPPEVLEQFPPGAPGGEETVVAPGSVPPQPVFPAPDQVPVQQQYFPPGPPQPPPGQQPYPYPPQYGGQPYPQQPYPYPPQQMPPGYAPQGYPTPPPPAPETPPPPNQQADSPKPASLPQVRLPDPSTTGVKEPPPQTEKPAETQPSAENPSNRAEDIIRQYMRRDAPPQEES